MRGALTDTVHPAPAHSHETKPGASAATEADYTFMARAVALARQGARAKGASPIGCVLVLDGAVVAEGHNEVGMQHDPTAHAEVVAIRRACQSLSREDLRGATLYSTLQPCGMCTMASIWTKVDRIVYGAGRDDVHRMYFEDKHLDTMTFIRDTYRDFEVVGGVLRDEVVPLYWGPDDDPPKEEQGNI